MAGERKYVSIDPGQVVLMSIAEYLHDGTFMNSRSVLSRREYYHKIGMSAAQICYEKWKIPIQQALDQMSEHHCKHVSWSRLLESIGLMLQNRDMLFEHMFNKCWAKKKFDIYQRKQSVISKAVNSLQDPTKPDVGMQGLN